MATSKTKEEKTGNGELLRLKNAKKNASSLKGDKGGENPIKDGPNKVLDAMAVKQAQALADDIGLEKLQKLFPDMAKLLEE